MRNGVDRRRASFTPWFWSYRWAARIEAAIVMCVFAGVIAIMVFLLQMPGPLVVHVQDDQRQPIKGARVRCTSPDGAISHVGLTDVFGEAKWPGLTKGAWKCEVTPPDLFHAGVETGFATVVARHPAIWITSIERPGRIRVQLVRPQGSPRAAIAVRVVCPGNPPETWEARAGLLDARVLLFVPHGKRCQVGIVRPELPGEGPATQAVLSCADQPCSAELTVGVGQEVQLTLSPTAAQWEAVRPPPEPDKPEPPKP